MPAQQCETKRSRKHSPEGPHFFSQQLAQRRLQPFEHTTRLQHADGSTRAAFGEALRLLEAAPASANASHHTTGCRTEVGNKGVQHAGLRLLTMYASVPARVLATSSFRLMARPKSASFRQPVSLMSTLSGCGGGAGQGTLSVQ